MVADNLGIPLQITVSTSTKPTQIVEAGTATPAKKKKGKFSKQQELASIFAGKEMAVLHRKDGQDYWIKGYEIFDPSREHSTVKGFKPYELKYPGAGFIYVVGLNQSGRPVVYPEHRITNLKPGRMYFRFEEIFGSSDRTSVVILDAEIAEQEDLEIGLATEIIDEE